MHSETCSHAESQWRLVGHGLVPKSHVYYVTIVRGDITRDANFQRLLNAVERDTENSIPVTLIVVSMASNVTDWSVKYGASKVLEVIDLGVPYSRQVGLRVGFQAAVKRAQIRGERDAIAVSIDVPMVLPMGFSDVVRQNTICGLSAYVPVFSHCSSREDDARNSTENTEYADLNGHTVNEMMTSFSMISLCLADYKTLKGWDTNYAYTTHNEDLLMVTKIKQNIPHILRTAEPNLFYSRNTSPHLQTYDVYKNQDRYDVPNIRLNRIVENKPLQARLVNFVGRQLGKKSDLQPVRLTKTYKEGYQGLNYHLVFKDKHSNETFYSLIESSLSPAL